MQKKRIRKEHVVTYLFICVLMGIAFGGLYFLNVSMTGFAVYEGPGEGQWTLMLQDADTENLGDAYVKGDTANKNFGLNEELHVRKVSPKKNSYLKFNISSIPGNQIIDNASLCLYLFNDQGSQSIGVYHVYSDWNEGSLDGVNCGSACDATQNITHSNQPCGITFENNTNCNLTAEFSVATNKILDGTWQCWGIVNMVGLEYRTGSNDISMVLHTEDLGDADKFYSKEVSDSILRPYLNITYHLANSAPTITLVEPKNQLYLDNESLSLNFSAVDSDGNLDSCWYSLNGGANILLPECLNTTFNVSEGSHTLVVYTNDTQGLEANDSVSFSVDINGVSVAVSEPTGTKSSRIEIPIIYSVIGNNLTCWYNIKTSIGGDVIENTTLGNCSSSSFDVSADGDYILNLYVNNTLGSSAFDSSGFSVDTSSGDVVVVSSGGGGGGSSRTTVMQTGTVELIVGEISDLIVELKDVKKINWLVKNTGTNFLNNCKLKGEGGYSSWVFSDEIKNLASGEEYKFVFDLIIPEIVEDGKYDLTVSLICQEVSESSNFVVEIIEKKLGFELVNVERNVEDKVKIIYLLEELSGLEQEVEIQFLLFDFNNEKVAEVKEIRKVLANSTQEFEILIPIDSSLEGELNLLVNLNSETYSTFVQENIILGSPISGFSVFGEAGSDNVLSGIFGILFLVFAFFMVRRILKHKKKKRK